MLELVERTRPGPFWAETIRMGTYLGIREAGTLVAMAGERLHPPGWTEISAVCTAPEWRGRGFASALVRQSAARIIARGERPFIHVVRDHTRAIDLYRQLGFTIRRNITFRGFRAPLRGAPPIPATRSPRNVRHTSHRLAIWSKYRWRSRNGRYRGI